MPLWKRQKIQKLLWAFIIGLSLFFSPANAQITLYGGYSPSIPLSQQWLDYVDKYPANEGMLAVEFPATGSLNWHFEGGFASLPKGGALESGNIKWLGAGMMIRKDFAGSFDVGLGPQIIYGFATAKGTINWNDSDTTIAFDGSATGFGIGINVGSNYKITKNLFCGLSFGIVYFGISEASVPIVGHNNTESSDSTHYLYTGEYISLSPRIVVGYEF